MIIKATYDDSTCYLNSDYIVDIFPIGTDYKAYTLDNDREGYTITAKEFEKLREEKNA